MPNWVAYADCTRIVETEQTAIRWKPCSTASTPHSSSVLRRAPHMTQENNQKGDTHLEVGHALPPLYADLAHIQHPIIEHADEGEPVRPLFGRLPDDEQARVVLLRPELERGRILERADGVFLRERDRVGPSECHLHTPVTGCRPVNGEPWTNE